MSNKTDVIIVHLGDGTWVKLDERPVVAWITKEQAEKLDEFPLDCMRFDHIHIRDLVENSHWNDPGHNGEEFHVPVTHGHGGGE